MSTATQTTCSPPAGGGLYRVGPTAVLDVLDEPLSLAGGLLSEAGRRKLRAAHDRVTSKRFSLVVLGEFKRGKSSLINALLERNVLPTAVVPLTSVVTTVGGGDRDRLIITYADGREQERPVTEIAEYVTEARNPANARGVELARVELDHELLRGGLELVDTPGSDRSTRTTPRSLMTSFPVSTPCSACSTAASLCRTLSGSCSSRLPAAYRDC